jgi:hypothetical protein
MPESEPEEQCYSENIRRHGGWIWNSLWPYVSIHNQDINLTAIKYIELCFSRIETLTRLEIFCPSWRYGLLPSTDCLFRSTKRGQTRSATHPMHVTVHLPLNLLPSRPFVHEPENLPVCPERASRLNACSLLPYRGPEGSRCHAGCKRTFAYYKEYLITPNHEIII